MSNRLDLVGEKFGRLMVLKKIDKVYVLCLCDCGKMVNIIKYNLKSGNTKSCGCLQRETVSSIMTVINNIHGMSRTRFYHIWEGMISRCYCNHAIKYNIYGGNGVITTKKWRVFMNFRNDMYDSYLEHVNLFGEKQTTLDRINGLDGYKKSNCRWATYKEQNNNRKFKIK